MDKLNIHLGVNHTDRRDVLRLVLSFYYGDKRIKQTIIPYLKVGFNSHFIDDDMVFIIRRDSQWSLSTYIEHNYDDYKDRHFFINYFNSNNNYLNDMNFKDYFNSDDSITSEYITMFHVFLKDSKENFINKYNTSTKSYPVHKRNHTLNYVKTRFDI